MIEATTDEVIEIQEEIRRGGYYTGIKNLEKLTEFRYFFNSSRKMFFDDLFTQMFLERLEEIKPTIETFQRESWQDLKWSAEIEHEHLKRKFKKVQRVNYRKLKLDKEEDQGFEMQVRFTGMTDLIQKLEREAIRQSYNFFNRDVDLAAKALGISAVKFKYKLKAYTMDLVEQ